jgi:hypothetical protein
MYSTSSIIYTKDGKYQGWKKYFTFYDHFHGGKFSGELVGPDGLADTFSTPRGSTNLKTLIVLADGGSPEESLSIS